MEPAVHSDTYRAQTQGIACAVQDEMERASHEGAPAMPLTIVFVERKNRCNEVAEALNAEGVPALPLHGGLSQVCYSTAASSPGTAASRCLTPPRETYRAQAAPDADCDKVLLASMPPLPPSSTPLLPLTSLSNALCMSRRCPNCC